MSVTDAKIFRIGDTDIRVEIDKETKEPKISGLEIETTEYGGETGEDDVRARAVSRVNLSYGHIKNVASTARQLSDFLEEFAKIQDIFDSKSQEGNESIFRRGFGLTKEEVQDALIAIATLRKHEHIKHYLGKRLEIVEESLILEEEREKMEHGGPAEIPIEMDDTIE